MIHFRIIGSIWLVSCLVPAVKLALELCSLATKRPYGPLTDDHGAQFWITQLLVEVSFLLIMLIGWGLIRLRRWAAVGGKFLGVISLLVCLWFILTQGMQHGPEPYVAIWCGVALSAYTLFAVWRFSPYDRIAEPLAAPNGGPAASAGSSGVAEGPPSVS
jgi:cell division protein FtsW (lipid II flippase)